MNNEDSRKTIHTLETINSSKTGVKKLTLGEAKDKTDGRKKKTRKGAGQGRGGGGARRENKKTDEYMKRWENNENKEETKEEKGEVERYYQ